MFLKVGPEIGHHLYAFVRPVSSPHRFDHSWGGDAEVFPLDVTVFDNAFGLLGGGCWDQGSGAVWVTKQGKGIIVGGIVGGEGIVQALIGIIP